VKLGGEMRFVLSLAMVALAAGVSHAEVLSPPQRIEIYGAMSGTSAPPGVWIERSAEDILFTFEQTGESPRLTTQIVEFARAMPEGSILVQTLTRRLYYVLGDGKAIEYPVGVGKEGFTWSGTNQITDKAEWPEWRPPLAMIEREAEKGRFLPEVMQGGEDNPLGARALYIGHTEYRIHGTTQPWSIGRAVSSGCIRMLNSHVIDLFDRTQIGALVVVE
jgi:lipoprotein-anchoring transpeptidase ErfK/SrfK